MNLYTKDVHIIEDVVQEVFLKLWENKEEYEIEFIKTYLFRTARNKVLNLLRDNQNRELILEHWFEQQLKDATDTKDVFETEKLLAEVNCAINSLPEKCKEIFLLAKTCNFTYKQIAESKNISIKTVENQMGIALKKIRNYLFNRGVFIFLFFSVI